MPSSCRCSPQGIPVRTHHRRPPARAGQSVALVADCAGRFSGAAVLIPRVLLRNTALPNIQARAGPAARRFVHGARAGLQRGHRRRSAAGARIQVGRPSASPSAHFMPEVTTRAPGRRWASTLATASGRVGCRVKWNNAASASRRSALLGRRNSSVTWRQPWLAPLRARARSIILALFDADDVLAARRLRSSAAGLVPVRSRRRGRSALPQRQRLDPRADGSARTARVRGQTRRARVPWRARPGGHERRRRRVVVVSRPAGRSSPVLLWRFVPRTAYAPRPRAGGTHRGRHDVPGSTRTPF